MYSTFRPSPAMIVAVIALFVSLGGTAAALSGSNTVFTDDIVNGEVKSADIENGQVLNADLGANAVNSGKIADGQVTSADIGNGQVTSADIGNGQVTSADLAGGFWSLAGNSGTTGVHFLGTTDAQPLNLRVNNARALRLEPASDGTNQSPNVIGGSADNTVTAGVHSATIAGGGRSNPSLPGSANRVTDHGGTIGGGVGNRAGGGGVDQWRFATVAGGSGNTAGYEGSTVGGGLNNSAIDELAATIAGGSANTASGEYAAVGGGSGNTAADGANPTVGGGRQNGAFGSFATVGGGDNNTAFGTDTVAGGVNNLAEGGLAVIGGGTNKAAIGNRSTVGGGSNNGTPGPAVHATVGGGQSNLASGTDATVGGGANNTASGLSAAVQGGFQNPAAGDYSVAAGRRASNTDASHDGVFLFADSSDFDFTSTATNEFAVRSTGGARVVTAIDEFGEPTAGVKLDSGDTAWEVLSDRASKENVAAVSPREVLRRLEEVPISQWNYKAQDPSIRHIGPMAQDFQRVFGLSGDDRTHISPIDTDGVALAAIKGLNERIDETLGGGPGSSGSADASGLAISPALLAGIAALAMIVAAAIGAALALHWSGRAGGRLAAS
jgi:hypothetical protein